MSFLRTSLATVVLASTSFLGCQGTETIETNEYGSSLRPVLGPRIPPSPATYYLARADTRRCAFPMCGGIFVSAVNQTTTRCPQGTDEAECYISDVDFSMFEGPSDGESTVLDSMGLEFETTPVVLQGTMYPSILGFGTFRVQMAWIAKNALPITGSFYGTRFNGVVCVVAPCPSYDQELLNRGNVASFHGFDFTAVPPHGEDSTFTGPALYSPYGLIVAGENFIDDEAGPGGPGTFLKASQVFIPVMSPVIEPGRRRRLLRTALPLE